MMSHTPLNHHGHVAYQAYAHAQSQHYQQHPQHPQHHQLNVGVHPASIQNVHPQHYQQHQQHQQQQQHHAVQYQHHQQHQQHHPHNVPSPAPSATTPTPQQQQQQQLQGTIAPGDTTYSPQASTSTIATPAPINTSVNGAAGNSDGNTGANANANAHSPLVAQGDWTKNLVHLAKTAELKKHALTLQLHTAHILSAHATLETKNKALQDIKEQRNRLESERTRLLNCLREVNEDRDKTDLLEQTINKECSDLRTKIQSISDGEFNTAKSEVDKLRAELGQPPTPSLQQLIEEKSAAYLNERRLASPQSQSQPTTPAAGTKRSHAESVAAGGSASASLSNAPAAAATSSSAAAGGSVSPADGVPPQKRPRGRPRGSKNKTKAKE